MFFRTLISSVLLTILLPKSDVSSQSQLAQDPMHKVNSFVEFGLAPNVSITRNTTGNNLVLNDAFLFFDDRYSPNIDAFLHVGTSSLHQNPNGGGTFLRSGLQLQNRRTLFMDTLSTEYRLMESSIAIPITVLIRIPQPYRTVKDEMYRATEIGFGIQFSSPITRSFRPRTASFVPNNPIVVKTPSKLGVHLEIAHTSYNKYGKGHRFGLRYQFESPISEIDQDTDWILLNYHSLAIFYNIWNNRIAKTSARE